MNIRNRVKELRQVKASELRPNPKNWRTHPDAQKNALRGILSEIGMADACLARELDDGSLMLIDGHLRAETVADSVVPVLILDVNEAEADKILATLDPLAAMADSDAAKLDELLRGVETGNEELQKLIAATAAQAGLYRSGTTDGQTAEEVWQGMPEFESENKMGSSSLIVHFANDDDRRAFAGVICQPLTEKTKSIWYPRQADEDLKQYET